MKRKKLIVIIIVLIVSIACVVVFVPWDILMVRISPLPNTVQEQVERAAEFKLDGVIVYVSQSSDESSLFAAGWQNRGSKTPMDPNALFKIASISKLYIAVAAVKLVDNQVLSLDSTLAVLLPEVDGRIENADSITLRMLLQHRSGIPDWIEAPDFPWDESITNVDDVLEFVLDDPADFKPDAKYDYSNTNYLLIGKIIDRTLGYSYKKYIKEQILVPLGLTNTFSSMEEAGADNVVSGYVIGYEGDVKMLDFVAPGSEMVATAEDVGIFLRALNDGSLLTDSEEAIYSSVYEYEHTGLLSGYSSIARYYEDIDAVVVLFANTSGGKSWGIVKAVYDRIIRILRNQNIQ